MNKKKLNESQIWLNATNKKWITGFAAELHFVRVFMKVFVILIKFSFTKAFNTLVSSFLPFVKIVFNIL